MTAKPSIDVIALDNHVLPKKKDIVKCPFDKAESAPHSDSAASQIQCKHNFFVEDNLADFVRYRTTQKRTS